MAKTTVYICADSTLTYGPLGGTDKIIPQALPIAFVEDEEAARALIFTIGRKAWDVPEADPDFAQTLAGRTIKPGYGPDWRYYCSLPEFEKNNVETIFAVMERVKEFIPKAGGTA
jgi:hypothetical protein